MEELIGKVISAIDISTMPNVVLWLLFIYFVVIRDLKKRFAGLSSYLKRYLAIQRRIAVSGDRLAAELHDLGNKVAVRRKDDCPPAKMRVPRRK